MSESIRQRCGLTASEAYFAFDSAKIDNRARRVLQKLAICFKTGPMAGESMKLVGHADPRGGTEYNMVLGGSRASSVESVLLDLGLSNEQITTTSRGELDATGGDEASWANDRRVDVLEG